MIFFNSISTRVKNKNNIIEKEIQRSKAEIEFKLKEKQDIIQYLSNELNNKSDDIFELNHKFIYLTKCKNDMENKHKADMHELKRIHQEEMDFLNNENISLSIFLVIARNLFLFF